MMQGLLTKSPSLHQIEHSEIARRDLQARRNEQFGQPHRPEGMGLARTARICFVSQNIGRLLQQEEDCNFVGGAELQQLLLARELEKRGYDVSFVTMAVGRGQDTLDSIKIFPTFQSDSGLPLIRFLYPRLRKTWTALAHADADIYYVRCAGFILAAVVHFARRHRKKVVFCGANDVDFDPRQVDLPVNWRDKPLYFWGLRRCDKIIAQNKTQRRLIAEHFGRQAAIIHNGYPKLVQVSRKRDSILWVANLRRHKNPEMFMELAKQFPEERFVMVGGATDGERSFYDSIIRAAQQVQNLEFRGFLPLKEVESEFQRAKLFVNTSGHEGFPNTFLQAWANGIPVVSFVDPDDLIRENNLGWVAQDLAQMTHILSEFLKCRTRFSSNKILDFFEGNLRIERVVDQYAGLFERLLSENPISY